MSVSFLFPEWGGWEGDIRGWQRPKMRSLQSEKYWEKRYTVRATDSQFKEIAHRLQTRQTEESSTARLWGLWTSQAKHPFYTWQLTRMCSKVQTNTPHFVGPPFSKPLKADFNHYDSQSQVVSANIPSYIYPPILHSNRHEFYETDEKVTISIFDRGADPAKVSIKFDARKVCLSFLSHAVWLNSTVLAFLRTWGQISCIGALKGSDRPVHQRVYNWKN